MNIPRILEKTIYHQLGKQKVIMLYGTRQVGKTTLIQHIAKKHKSDVLLLQGEDMQVAGILQQRTIANYQRLVHGKKIIIIDEAQVVPGIGQALKLMIDNINGITIIATGSSSFDLVAAAGEPLVGRQLVYQLYPIAQTELSEIEDLLITASNLEHRLIYGSYPELWHLTTTEEKETYLKSLVNSYLLKDVMMYETVKGADVLYKLLQLLAFQIGSEVSTVELGNTLQLSKNTVERYLDLLAKVFIIYPLSGYSNNLRKEVSKSKKWLFYDNGIRNAIISNFSQLQNRNDIGQLWEQYFLSERMKFNSYRGYKPQYYFWRTYDQQELDLIEVNNKQELAAYECKWKEGRMKIPTAFIKAYPNAVFNCITQFNYLDFITTP
ncbi:MAG TPA: ATP-binding protein [Chitinophagaceae bacterium]|nr:ATP-binding protein [Chitinophagaceae bacterium]